MGPGEDWLQEKTWDHESAVSTLTAPLWERMWQALGVGYEQTVVSLRKLILTGGDEERSQDCS